MPPVIQAIIAVLTAVGLGAVASTLAPVLLSLGASLVLGQISKLWQKGPSASTHSTQIASRSITSRAFHED